MALDSANMAWLIPLLIAVFQVVSNFISRTKQREYEATDKRLNAIEKLADENNRYIAAVEKKTEKLELEFAGTYLPRTEFAEFLNQLDERFERDRIETVSQLKLELRAALAEYRVQFYDQRKQQR
ncbi:hypothetical protein [Catenovulum sediminis]|uniref:Uncharacterized protein n=1 Tax=Catenovulum sediminis TaxID=1740262 RepID=A0ABV1RKG6_9ALTE